MNKEKYQRISQFMGAHPQYTLSDLAIYLKTAAPDLKTSKDLAYHKAMNDFLGAICGKETYAKSGTPIPHSTGDDFAGNVHLFLGGLGITLEDLADYVSERRASDAQRVRTDSMGMSDYFRSIPGNGLEGVSDLLERHEKINAPANVSMSEFLHNMPAGYGENK